MKICLVVQQAPKIMSQRPWTTQLPIQAPKITGLFCPFRINAQQLLTHFFHLKFIQSRMLMFVLYAFSQRMFAMMPTSMKNVLILHWKGDHFSRNYQRLSHHLKSLPLDDVVIASKMQSLQKSMTLDQNVAWFTNNVLEINTMIIIFSLTISIIHW